VDIGVATDDQTKFLEYIKTYPEAKDIQAAGENMIRLIHINGYHVDIKIISPQEWGSLLQHFTGSKAHNIHLRQFALTQGKSLSEWGIKSNGKLQKYTDEKKFYNDIKLDWIPPELREDRGEIEAAFKHKLPKLIELKDVKGDFHTHTNYDWVSSHDVGQSSFHELVDKALELNYKYFGLGDHNPSTGNYLSSEIIELLHKRQETIEKFKKQLVKEGINLAIFNTLEIDIKPDGSLAVPIDALKYLDYAVISIHSNLREDKVTQTKRLLTAMDYPKVKIIGHPTGRLINKRQGFELDWSQIFARCLENNIALEINANPVRLDIDEFVVRDAINHGVLLTIDTDTHHISNMDLMCFGVDVARRGWAESQNIVNAWPVDKVKQWMKVIK
jgi:DNA polymerase (family 10)